MIVILAMEKLKKKKCSKEGQIKWGLAAACELAENVICKINKLKTYRSLLWLRSTGARKKLCSPSK